MRCSGSRGQGAMSDLPVVGMVHYKVGGTDGVSLEMDKWRRVLEKAGYVVHYISGQIGDHGNITYPELMHSSDAARRLYTYSFKGPFGFDNEQQYRNKLYQQADRAQKTVEMLIVENNIECLIVENIWSVAMNPAVAIAVQRVAETHNLKVIAHHHDFFWERVGGVNIHCETARELIHTYLPPKTPSYTHVVINRQANLQLQQRCSISSEIIPNVFDFTQSTWEVDDYNRDFKAYAGLKDEDVMVVQATRVVIRKGIELAIDLVAELNKNRGELIGKRLWDGRVFSEASEIVLVLAGYDSDDGTGSYVSRLNNYAFEKGVRLSWAHEHIRAQRMIGSQGVSMYSLWDSYVHADLITYPSYWEGWGNQFLEAIFARKPIAMFEYPVFLSDIKPKGFSFISLGNTYTIDPDTRFIKADPSIMTHAARKAIEMITDPKRRRESVEQNFRLAAEYFSYEALTRYLLPLIQK